MLSIYHKIFFFLIIVASSFAFLVPHDYDRMYNSLAMVVYVLEVISFLKIKKINNYFDFDVIFLIIFGVSAFAYPVFFFMPEDPYIYFFNLSFDVKGISKAVSLSLIAATSYMIGGLLKCKKRNFSVENVDNQIISNRLLTVLIAIGILTFVLLGGISQVKSTYDKDVEYVASGGVLQIMAILQSCFVAATGVELYNKQNHKQYHFNRFLLLEVLLFSFFMIYAGNRTYAMIISLPLIFYYTMTWHKISFYQLCILLPVGFLLMWTIQVARTGRNVGDQTLEAVSVFRDVVIPSRSNYLVYEVVEKEGYTLGESMSGGIIGIIPSLERILKKTINLESYRIGSASRFTEYTFGDIGEGVTGLGTMLQADAYLSFGLIGVILIFGGIGFLVNTLFCKMLENQYYYIVAFMVLIGHSIFWIRAEATYPMKTLVWGLIIAYLNQKWRIKLE